MKREVPNDKLMDLLDEESTVTVDRQPWRHGYKQTFVFVEAGEHWRVTLDVHTDEGWQLYGESTTVQRVRAVEKTITAWEAY